MPYSQSKAYKEGKLKVSDLHTLHYEEFGNPQGKPVVFVHGGPGGGFSESDSCFFDPAYYRVILFDQRGAGKSTPTAELKDNTTWDCVADMEKLREECGLEQWLLFGGSWGSCLSLAYAEAHPDRCVGLVLRGIFTLRKTELDFFYQDGASHIHPEAYDEYAAVVPAAERGDLVKAYSKLLLSDDAETRVNAAKAWSKWEMVTSRLQVDPKDVAKASEDDWANAFARIENHYFINEGFMRDGQLLEPGEVAKIRHLPCIVVQGRYDIVCPFRTAWGLKLQWPELDLRIEPTSGHSAREVGMKKLLTEACDEFRDRGLAFAS